MDLYAKILGIGSARARQMCNAAGVDITAHMDDIHVAPVTLARDTLTITRHMLEQLRGVKVIVITKKY